MTPPGREVFGLALLVAGISILAWALFSNAFAPAYALDADPESEEAPPHATVYDFVNLSKPAQRAVSRAVDTGDSVTLRGGDNRAPEFAYGDWCGNDYVRYEGQLYHVCSWTESGSGGPLGQVYFAFAVTVGLVLSIAGVLGSKRIWRSIVARVVAP